MRRRLFSAALSSLFILAGAYCFHQFYKPKGHINGTPIAVMFAGQSTDQIVLSMNSEQQTKLLKILNLGSEDELRAIPGVTSNRAEKIQLARPFEKPEEIQQVHGIGPRTFESIAIYATAF